MGSEKVLEIFGSEFCEAADSRRLMVVFGDMEPELVVESFRCLRVQR
jgi:hypothetical protein